MRPNWTAARGRPGAAAGTVSAPPALPRGSTAGLRRGGPRRVGASYAGHSRVTAAGHHRRRSLLPPVTRLLGTPGLIWRRKNTSNVFRSAITVITAITTATTMRPESRLIYGVPGILAQGGDLPSCPAPALHGDGGAQGKRERLSARRAVGMMTSDDDHDGCAAGGAAPASDVIRQTPRGDAARCVSERPSE